MQNDGISELFRQRNAEMPHIAWPDEYQDAPAAKEHLEVATDTIEGQLVERAKKGERMAIDDLFERIRERCMAVALRVLHNADDAQDALQDAYLKIWKNLPTFEGRSSFSSWIHRIIVNACLDLMRRASNRPLASSYLVSVDECLQAVELVTTKTPEDLFIDQQRSAMIYGAVEALPFVQRQAIKLREFDDLAYDEVSKALDCPIGTVMSRIHHARKRLAEDLNSLLYAA
jgi:RNA polymerase sigma-70 factor (ECF subfamily)